MEEGMPARGTVEVLSCSMTRTPPGKTRTKMEDGTPARGTVEVLSCSMTGKDPWSQSDLSIELHLFYWNARLL
jgi:hypothetical protein